MIVQAGGQLGVWNGGTFTQNLFIAGTGYGEGGYETAVRMSSTTLSGSLTLTANANLAAAATSYILKGISGPSTAGLYIGTSSLGSTVELMGTNTYTGPTQINYGTLMIGGGGLLGSGTYHDTIANAGTLNFSTSNNQTLAGAISGATLIQADSGVTTLTGSNTYTGTTTVSGGTLAFATGSSFSGYAAQFLVGGVNNPTLSINGGTSPPRTTATRPSMSATRPASPAP